MRMCLILMHEHHQNLFQCETWYAFVCPRERNEYAKATSAAFFGYRCCWCCCFCWWWWWSVCIAPYRTWVNCARVMHTCLPICLCSLLCCVFKFRFVCLSCFKYIFSIFVELSKRMLLLSYFSIHWLNFRIRNVTCKNLKYAKKKKIQTDTAAARIDAHAHKHLCHTPHEFIIRQSDSDAMCGTIHLPLLSALLSHNQPTKEMLNVSHKIKRKKWNSADTSYSSYR